MATWTTIQIEDLYDYLCAAQLSALQNIQLSEWQINPIHEIIDDVTARIRAEISGNKLNLLSADKTKIPQDLKSCACYIILESAQTRLPSLKLTADQIRLASDAKDYLKRIAQGEIPVSIPDDAIPNTDFSRNSGCEVIKHRPSTVSSKTLQGL